MAYTLNSLAELVALPHDEVIDVRSPAEYAEDHIPGAKNLPVLNNNERVQVGTIYVQDNPFRARKIGAALVAINAARHLQTSLMEKDGSWRPLIYCWRGGQRSGAFAEILKQVGWRAETIEGGYKTYRRLVVKALYDTNFTAPVTLLDGNTGTAKTEILALLAQRGVQIIDLEGLAHHRGSLFGARAEGQPSQKSFEGALAGIIGKIDPTRPVVIEAESSKVGERMVPPALWNAMKKAPRIELVTPLEARAKYIVKTYADVIEDRERLINILDRLKRFHSAEQIEQWHTLASAGEMQPLAASLMAEHYDARYASCRSKTEKISKIHLADLAVGDLAKVADTIAKKMA